jgi:hypothetical protein
MREHGGQHNATATLPVNRDLSRCGYAYSDFPFLRLRITSMAFTDVLYKPDNTSWLEISFMHLRITMAI